MSTKWFEAGMFFSLHLACKMLFWRRNKILERIEYQLPSVRLHKCWVGSWLHIIDHKIWKQYKENIGKVKKRPLLHYCFNFLWKADRCCCSPWRNKYMSPKQMSSLIFDDNAGGAFWNHKVNQKSGKKGIWTFHRKFQRLKWMDFSIVGF